jgi:RNA polymerase sigma-70 factor (ECF subfamily)
METDWIERAKTGDKEALAQLLEAVASPVYRFSHKMCGNRAEADDVTQDTLLAAAQNMSQFAGHASFQSWVFAIARSVCSRRHRGQKNKPHQPEEKLLTLAAPVSDPESQVLFTEQAQLVQRGLDVLPPEQKEILWLRDVEGLSGQETADALGLSLEATKSRLHRARSALRQIVSESLAEGPPRPTHACPDVVEMMSRKWEGDLVVSDCAAMEKHVAACPFCKGRCDGLRQVLTLCQKIATERVPEQIRQKIRGLLFPLG